MSINVNFALNLIPMLAGVALLAHPELEGPDMEAKVENAVWSGLKSGAGKNILAVEMLEKNPIVAELVHLAIAKEVAAAQAELAEEAEKDTSGLGSSLAVLGLGSQGDAAAKTVSPAPVPELAEAKPDAAPEEKEAPLVLHEEAS